MQRWLVALIAVAACKGAKSSQESDTTIVMMSSSGPTKPAGTGPPGSAAVAAPSPIPAPPAPPVPPPPPPVDAGPPPPPPLPAVAPEHELHESNVVRLAIIDRERMALSTAGQLDVAIVDVRGKPLHRVAAASQAGARSEGVTAIASTNSDLYTAAAGGVRAWNVETGKPERVLLPEKPNRVVNRLEVLDDGSLAASVTPDRVEDDSTIEVDHWDAKLNRTTAVLPTMKRMSLAAVESFVMSPDRRRYATGFDQIVQLGAHSSDQLGSPFGKLDDGHGNIDTILALAWYEDLPIACMHLPLIGDAPDQLHVVQSSGPVVDFAGHAGGTQAAAFLPDHRLVTAGHDDQRVTVRNLDGKPLCDLTGVHGKLWAVTLSPDGKQLAAATDHQVLIWDLDECPKR